MANGTVLQGTLTPPASAVRFDDTGLFVVKGASVEAALTAVDAWANARPRSGDGHLAQLPADADATWPNDSTYFVDDQFGGVTYRKVAGHWTQQAAGVLQNTGWQLAAGPVLMPSLFDVKAVGTTETDIPLMSIAIPASAARGILIRFRSIAVIATGTASSGSGVTIQLYLADSANNHVSGDFPGGQSVAGAAFANLRTVVIEKYLAPPVAAMTYKLRARLSAAAPSGWGGATIDPTAISNITDSSALYAVYAA